MVDRRILAFLIKVGPVFLALLWLWHSAGLSAVYHRMLAGFLNVWYPHVDPMGVVAGAVAEEQEVMLRLLVAGRKTGLAINGEDITSNFAMLAALYLSSPIRRHWRLFLVHFASSAVVIFVLHALTVFTFSQQAFMSHPEIAKLGYTRTRMNFTLHYNVFYEAMGMYLFVLVLWFPYILHVIRDPRHARTGAPTRPA